MVPPGRLGGEEGSRCDAGAAPATVSGERNRNATGAGHPGKAGEATTRKPGDLPGHEDETVRRARRRGLGWSDLPLPRRIPVARTTNGDRALTITVYSKPA